MIVVPLMVLAFQAALAPQDGVVVPQVEVAVFSVNRLYEVHREWEGRWTEDEFSHVEAVLFGPFFEPGRAEELTIRFVPEESLAADIHYGAEHFLYSLDPWRALRRFVGGVAELYRGGRLLTRVEGRHDWLEIEGLSYSQQSGLLNIHVLDVSVGSGTASERFVLRYLPATGQMEAVPYVTDDPDDPHPGMTCGPGELPFPVPDAARTIFFRPCRSLVG